MSAGWDKPLTDWVLEIENFTNKEVQRLATAALRKIKAKTPVISGTLRAGWYIEQMKRDGIVEIQIVNDVPYAIFVEYGTSKMAGVHMLEQTLNEIIDGTI